MVKQFAPPSSPDNTVEYRQAQTAAPIVLWTVVLLMWINVFFVTDEHKAWWVQPHDHIWNTALLKKIWQLVSVAQIKGKLYFG